MSCSRAAAFIAFAVVFVAAAGATSYWLMVAVLHQEAHPLLSSLSCLIFGYCFGETISRRVFVPLGNRIFTPAFSPPEEEKTR